MRGLVETVARILADRDWMPSYEAPADNWARLTFMEQERYKRDAQAVIPLVLAEAAKVLRDAIGKGYPSLPPHETCEHGQLGAQDCIGCYDKELEKAATAIERLGE